MLSIVYCYIAINKGEKINLGKLNIPWYASIQLTCYRFSLSIKAYKNMAGIDAVSNVSVYNIYSPALTFSA